MASFVYNRGLKELLDNTGRWNDTGKTYKVMLVIATGYVASANRDDDFVDSGATDPLGSEVSVGGYARQTLTGASMTVTEVDGSDRVELDAPDVVFSSLVAGQTIGAAIIYRDTGDDTTSVLIAFIDLIDTPTSGGDITLQWAASGILNFNTA